jgi:hypothetical protein
MTPGRGWRVALVLTPLRWRNRPSAQGDATRGNRPVRSALRAEAPDRR